MLVGGFMKRIGTLTFQAKCVIFGDSIVMELQVKAHCESWHCHESHGATGIKDLPSKFKCKSAKAWDKEGCRISNEELDATRTQTWLDHRAAFTLVCIERANSEKAPLSDSVISWCDWRSSVSLGKHSEIAAILQEQPIILDSMMKDSILTSVAQHASGQQLKQKINGEEEKEDETEKEEEEESWNSHIWLVKWEC